MYSKLSFKMLSYVLSTSLIYNAVEYQHITHISNMKSIIPRELGN